MNASRTLSLPSSLPLFGFSWIDLLLPPILLLLAWLLHTLYNIIPLPPAAIHGHLFTARTSHARFLPLAARHSFAYPVIFLGVDLDALESGKLELGGGRLLSYDAGSRWSLTSLRSRMYMEPGLEGQSIREKLWRHLEQRGVRAEQCRRIYTVTMPGLLGLHDINPLTVHFCYSETVERGRKLEMVVLEVSNTFGEKHIYLLRVGEEEDPEPAVGYQHQWTFPRAFHVSPFNDRSGFYTVALSDPLHTDSPSPFLPVNPRLALQIITLTTDWQKKLFASLSSPSSPLRPSTLLGALLRWPFSLLLTTPRIFYQAMLLHYKKRLDVFPRPEPHSTAASVDALGNPVEFGGKEGGVQWQAEGTLETLARERVCGFLERRVRQLFKEEQRAVEVTLVPADKSRSPIVISPRPSASPTPVEPLTIVYLSPLFFVDLLAAPTTPLALAMGSHTERRWSTSNDELFLAIFASPICPTLSTRSIRLIRRLRLAMMRWGLSFGPAPSSSALHDVVAPHPLDDETTTLSTVMALWWHFMMLKLGYWIFVATGARFVRGTEPWEDWARWSARVEGPERPLKGEVVYGSVLRA